MLDPRAFDRTRKAQGFLKAAVGYFHLVIRHADGTDPVASRTSEIKDAAFDHYLDVLGGNTRQLDLYYPAFGRAVNIRGRVPQLARRLGVLRRSQKMKITIDRLGHKLQ